MKPQKSGMITFSVFQTETICTVVLIVMVEGCVRLALHIVLSGTRLVNRGSLWGDVCGVSVFKMAIQSD